MKNFGFSSLVAIAFLIMSCCTTTYSVRLDGIQTRPYTVHITNAISDPSPLIVRVQSKDNDLGNHTLATGQTFSWHFNENFLSSTLFFARFWWQQITTSFNVFYSPERDACTYTVDCYWSVRPDGFYFSNNNSSWTLKHTWTN
ncbi:hypothetical protein U1Q18_030843 [Sarracenia purpurea var. burkii]